MERAVMIYLALATVITAALLPSPLRILTASAREQQPPTGPPTPAASDKALAQVGTEVAQDACNACEGVVDSLRIEAGVVAMELAADPEGDTLFEPPPARGEDLAHLAAGLAGLPYSWGGISPATGFDCSGLVYYVHQQLGVTLSRDAAAQFGNGRVVHRPELQPGDIVFFSDTDARAISHDGIYLGDGSFVHATQPGSVVRIASMGDDYWAPRYVGARRVFEGW